MTTQSKNPDKFTVKLPGGILIVAEGTQGVRAAFLVSLLCAGCYFAIKLLGGN